MPDNDQEGTALLLQDRHPGFYQLRADPLPLVPGRHSHGAQGCSGYRSFPALNGSGTEQDMPNDLIAADCHQFQDLPTPFPYSIYDVGLFRLAEGLNVDLSNPESIGRLLFADQYHAAAPELDANTHNPLKKWLRGEDSNLEPDG